MSFENQSPAFSAALDYLYSFINFERKKQDRYMASKIDTERPLRLMMALDSPHTRYPVLHVAGTKGKGSVSAMCAASLRAAGLKVGLYTSPHLVDFRERIRILTPSDADGRIPEDAFVQHIDRIKQLVPEIPDVTWFEVLTAVAFLHFATNEVDAAVIEVGLGGRLDATNVVTPLVSVITSLSLDHTEFLGDTLAQIAYEKGGIIKPGIPVVSAPQPPQALHKLRDIAAQRQSPLTVVGEAWRFVGQRPSPLGQLLRLTQTPSDSLIPVDTAVPLPLLGEHQLENATVAIAALTAVQAHFPTLTTTAVQQGLAQVQWNGRLQILHPGSATTPMLLVDCAHNPDSAQKLRQALTTLFDYRRLWFIIGAPADKDVAGVLQQLLPLGSGLITTTASHPRSMPPADMVALAESLGFSGSATPDMATAIRQAWRQAKPGDLICVTGSIIVVGDLLNQWDSLQSQLLQATAVVPPQA